MKHIQPITSEDFFSLLANKPAIDSAPLRKLEAQLARIELDALTGGAHPLALPAPNFFPVPPRCCRPDGTLRDMMPNCLEWFRANEATFAPIDPATETDTEYYRRLDADAISRLDR